MFRLKICGLLSVDNALEVAAAGADAIGLNFYAAGKRYVRPERAAEIVAALPAKLAKVGVFVNSSAAEITTIARQVGLDYVQLHGDEPASVAAELIRDGLRVIRAVRCSTSTLAKPLAWLAELHRRGGELAGLLVDAEHAGEYGGTGTKADWKIVETIRRAAPGVPLILAGGLRPENVAAAIQAVRPDAVDTASGVETSPGVKDPLAVARFAAAALAAFQ